MLLCACSYCSQHKMMQRPIPIGLFPILELQNPSNDVPELHEIRQSPDRQAKKMRKGRSGFTKHIRICTQLLRYNNQSYSLADGIEYAAIFVQAECSKKDLKKQVYEHLTSRLMKYQTI